MTIVTKCYIAVAGLFSGTLMQSRDGMSTPDEDRPISLVRNSKPTPVAQIQENGSPFVPSDLGGGQLHVVNGSPEDMSRRPSPVPGGSYVKQIMPTTTGLTSSPHPGTSVYFGDRNSEAGFRSVVEKPTGLEGSSRDGRSLFSTIPPLPPTNQGMDLGESREVSSEKSFADASKNKLFTKKRFGKKRPDLKASISQPVLQTSAMRGIEDRFQPISLETAAEKERQRRDLAARRLVAPARPQRPSPSQALRGNSVDVVPRMPPSLALQSNSVSVARKEVGQPVASHNIQKSVSGSIGTSWSSDTANPPPVAQKVEFEKVPEKASKPDPPPRDVRDTTVFLTREIVYNDPIGVENIFEDLMMQKETGLSTARFILPSSTPNSATKASLLQKAPSMKARMQASQFPKTPIRFGAATPTLGTLTDRGVTQSIMARGRAIGRDEERSIWPRDSSVHSLANSRSRSRSRSGSTRSLRMHSRNNSGYSEIGPASASMTERSRPDSNTVPDSVFGAFNTPRAPASAPLPKGPRDSAPPVPRIPAGVLPSALLDQNTVEVVSLLYDSQSEVANTPPLSPDSGSDFEASIHEASLQFLGQGLSAFEATWAINQQENSTQRAEDTRITSPEVSPRTPVQEREMFPYQIPSIEASRWNLQAVKPGDEAFVFPTWHHRPGDMLPTFLRERRRKGSKDIQPPQPIFVQSSGLGARVEVGLPLLPPNPPTVDPRQQAQNIQSHLREYQDPVVDQNSGYLTVAASLNRPTSVLSTGSDTMLLQRLEREMGDQERDWQALHQDLDRDSIFSGVLSRVHSPRKPLNDGAILTFEKSLPALPQKPQSPRSQRTMSVNSKSSRASMWRKRLAEAQEEYEGSSLGIDIGPFFFPQAAEVDESNASTRSHSLDGSNDSRNESVTEAFTKDTSPASTVQDMVDYSQAVPGLWKPTPRASIEAFRSHLWSPSLPSKDYHPGEITSIRYLRRSTIDDDMPITAIGSLWQKAKELPCPPRQLLWGLDASPNRPTSKRASVKPQRKSKRYINLADIGMRLRHPSALPANLI
jgi:hypothetical protein